MIDEPMKQLAVWMQEVRRRQGWHFCLMPDEPVIYRGVPRQSRSTIERSAGEVLSREDLEQVARAILGSDRLAELGHVSGVADARIQLPDGTHASVTASRAGGQVTLVVRPVRSVSLDWQTIRVPEPIIRAAESATGLLIVTGSPGSGKTTTSYAILEHLNATQPIHIVTVGYHFEYVLEPKQAIVQERQIGVDAPDMLAGIQSAILQGADVIFVAEVRDLEVFQACLRAAEMDCLVLVQLHLPTPGTAIERMIALQSDEMRPVVCTALSEVVRGGLGQTLLPTTAGKQVAAYGALLPDDEVRRLILQGGHGLDDRCSPRMQLEIERLRNEGRVSAEAAGEALRRLGR